MKLRKYRQSYLLSIKQELKFKFNFFMKILSALLSIVALYYFWKAIYKGVPNHMINGYNFHDMFYYLLLTNAIYLLTKSFNVLPIMRKHYNGNELTVLLSKPLNYKLFLFSNCAGSFLTNLITAIIVYLPFILIFRPEKISLSYVLFFLLSLFLGIMIQFLYYFILGLFVYFTKGGSKSTASIDYCLNKMFGGSYIPIHLYALFLQTLSKFLPFQYMTYIPALLLLGEATSILGAICMQFFWLVVLSFSSRYLWKKATKYVESYGG